MTKKAIIDKMLDPKTGQLGDVGAALVAAARRAK